MILDVLSQFLLMVVKMKINKKLILIFCIITLLLVSLVMPFAFADNVITNDSSTSYTFNGSLKGFYLVTNYTYPFPTVVNDKSTINIFSFVSVLDFSLFKQDNNICIDFMSSNDSCMSTLPYSFDSAINNGYATNYGDFTKEYIGLQSSGVLTRTDLSINNTNIIYDTESLRFLKFLTNDIRIPEMYMPLFTSVSGDFTCNVVSRTTFYDSVTQSNIIRYFDIDNNFVQLRFPVMTSYQDNILEYWQERYFIETNILYESMQILESTIYYNNYFESFEDYDVIFNEGELSGIKKGYEQGFDAGEDYGYDIGFREGVDSRPADQGFTVSSFFSDVLSVLDVKIFGLFSLSTLLYVALAFIFIRLLFNLFK